MAVDKLLQASFFRKSACIIVFSSSLTVACVSSSQTADKSQTGGQCTLRSQQLTWNHQKPPKLIFMSLDGLNFDALAYYTPMLKSPHPQGLSKLLKHPNSNPSLIIKNPTITSSSHTTTITCASAEKHGIFANSQWNGRNFVSGFNAPTATETFATRLKNSGLKIITAGYPALDQSEPGREISEGFAYGENISQPTIVYLNPEQPLIHAWLNKQNEEIGRIEIGTDRQKTISVACKTENCTASPTPSRDFFDIRLTHQNKVYSGYAMSLNPEKTQAYISQLATNEAFPTETAETLGRCGLVFSPGKDLSLARLGTQHIIAGLRHRLSFFRDTWFHYLPQTDADAMFLYLEDIDSLRHQFSGDKDSEQLMVRHLEEVDQVLGRFLESLPKETNVVIMGDHGMSTVWREINMRKVLPSKALEEAIVVTSGGTLMLYSKRSQSTGDLSATPSQNDHEWLNETKQTLSRFRLHDSAQPVFEQVYIKGKQDMILSGLSHPDAPFLIAFANEQFGLRDSLSDQLILSDVRNPKLPVPTPRGQHGHFNLNPTMKSFLALWGPQLNSVQAQKIETNTDVVPSIAKALNWPIPSHCQKQVR